MSANSLIVPSDYWDSLDVMTQITLSSQGYTPGTEAPAHAADTAFNHDPNGGQMAGVDENGNPLYAHYDNNPPPAPGDGLKTDPNATFDTLNTSYATASAKAKAGGMSDAQWVQSDEYKGFQSQIINQYGSTTDTTKLSGDIAYFKANLSDPVQGANYRKLLDAAQNQLDKVNDPLTPFTNFNINGATPTEDAILANQQHIYDAAQQQFTALQDFQRDQRLFQDQIAQQITDARAFSIPHAPEQSGRFIAAGATAREAQARVGIGDLLIRF